jgi:hypothetical protein
MLSYKFKKVKDDEYTGCHFKPLQNKLPVETNKIQLHDDQNDDDCDLDDDNIIV